MNYRLIAFVIGEICIIVGALMCIPLFMSLGFKEDPKVAVALAIAIATCIVIGIIGLALRPPKDKRNLRPTSGFAICGMIWIVLALIGAMPYCISGSIPNYVDALFETVSGFTTTGASILTNVEAMPKSLLFWRALTQWIGGMGVLVLAIAILPRSDKMATALARAEIPGPQFGKLVSKLRFTSIILYAIYIALTLLLVAILCICKMPVFDSFCHAFSTASTGGFSVKNASIAAYNSVAIEVVITIFMMLFSVNFNIYFMIIVRHYIKALKNEELIWLFSIFIAVTAILTIDLCVRGTYKTVGEALRYSSFNVASIMSTTGFGTADFTGWSTLTQVMLLAVMCIGGSAGSTAGGMKMSRAIILTKSSYNSLKKTLSPRSVYSVKMDGKAVPENVVSNIRSFFLLYAIIVIVSTILVSIEKPSFADGSVFSENFSAVISCFNNIGPGIGAIGPAGNYSGFGIFSKLVLTMDMLLGRLEILPILLMFLPRSWKRI